MVSHRRNSMIISVSITFSTFKPYERIKAQLFENGFSWFLRPEPGFQRSPIVPSEIFARRIRICSQKWPIPGVRPDFSNFRIFADVCLHWSHGGQKFSYFHISPSRTRFRTPFPAVFAKNVIWKFRLPMFREFSYLPAFLCVIGALSNVCRLPQQSHSGVAELLDHQLGL